MRPLTRYRLHALERRGGVARLAQVIAVDVHGVRQRERVRGTGEGLENLARRDRTRPDGVVQPRHVPLDRKSTRLNSSHGYISYAVFCLKKKKAHDNALHAHAL